MRRILRPVIDPREPNEIRGRRATIASLPTLIAVIAVFFLPTLPSCEQMESPLSYGASGVGFALAAWPVFVAAVALVVGGVVSLARGQPTRGARIAMAPFVAASALSTIVVDAILVYEDTSAASTRAGFVAVIGPCLIAGSAAAWTAVRLGGWRGWVALILTWFAFALVSLPSVLIAPAMVNARDGVGPGAWVWCCALIALVPAMAVAAVAPTPAASAAADSTPPRG